MLHTSYGVLFVTTGCHSEEYGDPVFRKGNRRSTLAAVAFQQPVVAGVMIAFHDPP